MSKANDSEILKVQYTSDKNLNARIAIHREYSINKYGWEKWVFDQLEFKKGTKLIEFGCGNGALWEKNKERIPKDISIVLVDISEGMLEKIEGKLSDVNEIEKFINMDIQNIEYKDKSFDLVVANHMLYHVPNREKALGEVARVLKDDGVFYAATNGRRHMAGLQKLVGNVKEDGKEKFSIVDEFGLDNGREQLLKYFEEVEMIRYEDALHITEPTPLIDYFMSLEGHIDVDNIMTENKRAELYKTLNEIILRDGYIEIPKESGMFIARKPLL